MCFCVVYREKNQALLSRNDRITEKQKQKTSLSNCLSSKTLDLLRSNLHLKKKREIVVVFFKISICIYFNKKKI
jgi:hypothetical protein